ncbi:MULTISPECIES: hypothetical protein [Streptosporangium]|uniref:Uncharacterized protein n=1 Tax=Streptosporangium brasiliense TaxID=47480 RepID=A0ABT9RNB5_9ACTN|nr:hypothetical protein [Streptosporangium brasiliense]MDP9870337.1 hypothetical protein [Streptosporangium brasiliense]
MPKISVRKAQQPEDGELMIVQCRACRAFMGYAYKDIRAFCSDIWCAFAREWVWDTDTENTDLFTYMADAHNMAPATIAAAAELPRPDVHDRIKTGRARALRTKI